jgi:AAHS family 4-hydroxybenzoate transporter-like MFS transporter
VAAGLIPHFGWQSVFVVGGVMPLALAVVLVLVLPESARFLIVKQRPMAQIQAVVRRIAPGADVGVTRFTVPEEGLNKPKSSLHGIFTPQLAAGTLMLWSTYFFGLVVIYLLTSWLPTLMGQVGFSISTAAWVTACFQLGGTAGALLVGWAMDHFRRPHTVLALTYVLAALFIFIVGRASGNAALLAVAVLAGGFFMSGAQTPLAALSAAFYPTQVRATGISWMMGIGRFGSILGAGIGGQLLPLGFEAIFALLAIPALIAAFAVAMKGRIYANLANAPVQVAPVRDTSAA